MGMKTNESQNTLLKLEGREVVIGIWERADVRKLFLSQREVQQDKIPVAPAYYIGRQKGTNGMGDFDLFNLMQAIPGHSQGSTVSGKTLAAAGFQLPPCVRKSDQERALPKIRRLAQPIAGCCG